MDDISEILERVHLREESLNNLPPDVIQEIFLDLSVEEIMKLCRSSIAFNTVCERESFWQTKVWTDFGIEKKYSSTWRKTAENLFKMKMINLNKKWVNGMTYREIIDKIANRTEFEAEEKLNIDRLKINDARMLVRYRIDDLKDFITQLGETPAAANNRQAFVNQLKTILNIGTSGLLDIQLQYLPNTIVSPDIRGHTKRIISEMLGRYYDDDQLEVLAIELLDRELTNEEFKIIQDTLTREFTIIIIAISRYTRSDMYISKGHYPSFFARSFILSKIPVNDRYSEGFDLLHDMIDINLLIMSITPYSDETISMLIDNFNLVNIISGLHMNSDIIGKSMAPRYNTF
uniref:F-box-like protein n=1 Tax=Pithovirus LCPAC401 TaxID=2506595 RepID=A0A481ZAX8_9VIRU|nr:MAG: F-box-like protein [Pithovirus LCPAC401]